MAGRHLIARAVVESTNDVAWEAAAQGLPDGTTVVADAQTRGRGRAGRAWNTGQGRGLALSVLLHAGCAPPAAAGGGRGAIPLAAGLALARTPEGVVSGVARGLDAGGGLVIEREGKTVTVLAGDLEFAAAAEST